MQQKPEPAPYKVDVNLVAVTFVATDGKGRPFHGLKASDIRIYEDGIPQRLAAFAGGAGDFDRALLPVPDGSNLFILFDTSNRMYENIPYVCDAIADLLRRLDPADAVAIYTFSRNLYRAAALTTDHSAARAALAQKVAVGDDTALFNCLLLTLRDAAKIPGRKAVILFSNGPDNKSALTPDDVGTVAVNEGIPVYVISTMNAGTPTADVLERLAQRSGGKAFLQRKWKAQADALAAVHDDIRNSYTAYYYPSPNANQGFRHIRLQVVSARDKGLRIRARAGYDARKAAVSGAAN